MKLISHRGNYSGIIPERENKPSYIDTTISMGYEVEVDVRYIDGDFYLGHDGPETKISEKWILNRKNDIWFHCKDLYSALKFSEMNCDIKYFCHSSDSYVLTSTNHIWVHDLSLKLNDKCIIPLLTENEINTYKGNVVYGICLDNISSFKNKVVSK